MHTEEEQGERLVLARSAGFGEVSLCTCGAVMLELEGVRLRFSSEAFVQLVQLVQTSAHSAVLHAGLALPGIVSPMVQ